MSAVKPKPLSECSGPVEALLELCAPFVTAPHDRPECEVVSPEQMPEPFHWLLVLKNHMTKVLEAQYGRPMELEVVEHHLEDEFYTRRILLRETGHHDVVEIGIVRLNFRYMSHAVRDEILARHTPLGAILIRHKILRRVEPRWYLRFPPNAPLLARAGVNFPHTTYGRIATIYCNHEPAIELLEIVTGVERTFDERIV